jgi:hypothetical protein
MFGVSRLAFQFPDRHLAPLFWRAVVTSWAIVMLPHVLAARIDPLTVMAAAGAVAAVAAGAAGFVWAEPDIRHARQNAARWVYQSAAAGAASLAALVWLAIARWLIR